MLRKINDRNLYIRSVKSGDWSSIKEVYIKMLNETPEGFGETISDVEIWEGVRWKEFAVECEKGNLVAAFVVEMTGEICGFVKTDSSDPCTPPKTTLVSQLWVDRKLRSQGFGKELMNEVEKWSKLLECKEFL